MKGYNETVRTVFVACLLAATSAEASWIYEGKWGSPGTGHGQFRGACGIAVGIEGNIYVVERDNRRVQYFTPTGSFLGTFGTPGSTRDTFQRPLNVAVGPSGNVYVADAGDWCVKYFTASGSFLGKWGTPGSGYGQFYGPSGIDVAPNGNVYVTEYRNHRVQYFTSTGSYLGQWGTYGSGNGQFIYPTDVAVSANGSRVYVVDPSRDNKNVQCFTADGSFICKWRCSFEYQTDVSTAPNGNVFVADRDGHRVLFFKASGSFLGTWGAHGTRNGRFEYPSGIAVSLTGARVYVSDDSARIQYFNRNEPIVAPTSLGRVKALFR